MSFTIDFMTLIKSLHDALKLIRSLSLFAAYRWDDGHQRVLRRHLWSPVLFFSKPYRRAEGETWKEIFRLDSSAAESSILILILSECVDFQIIKY